jgi:hypothetical protein
MITYTKAELYTTSTPAADSPNGTNKVCFVPDSNLSFELATFLHTSGNFKYKEVFGTSGVNALVYIKACSLISLNLTFGQPLAATGSPIILWT